MEAMWGGQQNPHNSHLVLMALGPAVLEASGTANKANKALDKARTRNQKCGQQRARLSDSAKQGEP